MSYVNAFRVGGLLCAAGQILMHTTNNTTERNIVNYHMPVK
jgi:hypothetical protein